MSGNAKVLARPINTKKIQQLRLFKKFYRIIRNKKKKIRTRSGKQIRSVGRVLLDFAGFSRLYWTIFIFFFLLANFI